MGNNTSNERHLPLPDDKNGDSDAAEKMEEGAGGEGFELDFISEEKKSLDEDYGGYLESDEPLGAPTPLQEGKKFAFFNMFLAKTRGLKPQTPDQKDIQSNSANEEDAEDGSEGVEENKGETPGAEDALNREKREPSRPGKKALAFFSRRKISATAEEITRSQRYMNLKNRLKNLLTRPTFLCQICLENVDERLGYSYGGLPCVHIFCRTCLQTHLTGKINEAVVKHPCPLQRDQGCGNFATQSDITELCGEDFFAKMERFSKLQGDAEYRECPQCGQLQRRQDPSTQKMVCEGCEALYCFTHASAHPMDVSCVDFERGVRSEGQRTRALIQQLSKPCPSCRAPTEKLGGCNHMTCSRCQADWCWLCSRALGGPDGSTTSRHYDPWNFAGCPGGQFAELSNFAELWAERFFVFLIVLLLAALLLPTLAVATAVAVVAVLLAWPWSLARRCLDPSTADRLLLPVLLLPPLLALGVFLAAWAAFAAAWAAAAALPAAAWAACRAPRVGARRAAAEARAAALAPAAFVWDRLRVLWDRAAALEVPGGRGPGGGGGGAARGAGRRRRRRVGSDARLGAPGEPGGGLG